MTFFVAPEIETDRSLIKERAIAKMEEQLPGWTPGPLEDAIFEAWAQVAAEHAEVLIAQLIAAYRSLGPLFGVPAIEAQPAHSLATFTMIDAAGYTLEPGAVVLGIRDADGELQAFSLVEKVVIAAASTTGMGLVEALKPGEAANGLTGAAQLIEAPPSVASATMATSGNGLEAEDDAAYLNRLAETLALIKPGPVRAIDAATIARSIPGVGRATAVDNLKPSEADGGEGGEESGVEKCVTVAATDAAGKPASASVLLTITSLLQEEREGNFRFFVVKPHYTKLDVTAIAFAWPGYDLAVVKAAIIEGLENFLSPARWATDFSGIPARWANDPVVRQSELFAAVANVRGVRWCSSLLLAEHGKTLGTADVILGPGSAVPALPELTGSVFNITVEPSG